VLDRINVQNNPVNAIDPLGLAEYLVVWDMRSATWEFGTLNVNGFVVDPKPIRSKTDGEIVGYNALKFRGGFVGGSISLPFSSSTANVAWFEDNLSKPNLYNIEGDSLISNNCPGSKTHFGNLIQKGMIRPGKGFNIELVSGFTGNIEAANSSYVLSKEAYQGYLGGKP
jgi:hypothetical protein